MPVRARFGYDDVYGYVEIIRVDLVNHLEVVADTDCNGAGLFQQPVVVALTAANSVASAVERDSRNDYHLHRIDILAVIACRLFDSERADMHPRLVKGKDIEIDSIDAGEEEAFTAVPFLDKIAGRKLVGQRIVDEYTVAERKSCQLLESMEYALGG